MKILAAFSLAIALTACGGQESDGDPATERDPYEVYLENAPDGAPSLSREDAQTRALLGCGTDWARGTVDAALQDAYEPDC